MSFIGTAFCRKWYYTTNFQERKVVKSKFFCKKTFGKIFPERFYFN